jgi:hypothetical protein
MLLDGTALFAARPRCRALRLLRLSLLEGNLPHMRLSQGALLAGAVNVPLLWLVFSVMAWLFTSAAIVQVRGQPPAWPLSRPSATSPPLVNNVGSTRMLPCPRP